MYLALGETDDWAHDGRYDRVLETYARTDEYLRAALDLAAVAARLSRPDAHPDHDRSRPRAHAADWRNHGAKVEGAQEVWMAFVSPRETRRGEWRDHAAASHQSGGGNDGRLDGSRLECAPAGRRASGTLVARRLSARDKVQ